MLGVAGLLGSGRTELARAISGIDKLHAGIIRIQGSDESIAGPRSAISLGIVYSSENRRTEGIISGLSVQENITLAPAERGILRRIRPSRQRELALSWVDALDIRPPDVERPAGTLSGGNEEKPLLARLLALSPRLLVLDEPTRGIDVGAKVEVQNLIGELADNGLSVMFISAELEEVLRVGNRVVVVQDGRIVDTAPSEEGVPSTSSPPWWLVLTVRHGGLDASPAPARGPGATSSTQPASPVCRTRPSRGSSTTCRTSGPRPAARGAGHRRLDYSPSPLRAHGHAAYPHHRAWSLPPFPRRLVLDRDGLHLRRGAARSSVETASASPTTRRRSARCRRPARGGGWTRS